MAVFVHVVPPSLVYQISPLVEYTAADVESSGTMIELPTRVPNAGSPGVVAVVYRLYVPLTVVEI